ncbi:hypothetical protein BELL_0318g00080 [Botrytis elliptica]|uniref:Uncharacterized protein n=1 Tax=Botrytis elliptica TaxID=278938 RepID=A0A4Z1JXU6_9HELO|nr:hypothetical protein BELL_0318g00080 [Botrytis elliptica]
MADRDIPCTTAFSCLGNKIDGSSSLALESRNTGTSRNPEPPTEEIQGSYIHPGILYHVEAVNTLPMVATGSDS